MKKLNIAILGQGRSGLDIHCNYLKNDTERFCIKAVVDALPERREKAEKLFSCDTYADYKELFGRNDIDFVVNSLPSHFHPPVTIDLLNHGFNVMTEKPMARTKAEADLMIATAKKNNKMLAVFQQSHFASYFQKVREVIDSGKLGKIIQIQIYFDGFARRWDWQTCQEFGAGSLYNTGPHPMEQALTLLDLDENQMPDIFCKMDRANSFGDAEDFVKIMLSAKDRPLIDLEISSCNAYSDFNYNVQGTNGGMKGTLNAMKWRYFKPEEAPTQHLIKTPLMKPDGSPAYCSENLKFYEEEWKANPDDTPFTTAVGRMYTTIYRHLTENEPLVVTPEMVAKQIAVMEKCHEMNPFPRF